MGLKSALAGAPSFAHLIGFGRARAEQDDRREDDREEEKMEVDEEDTDDSDGGEDGKKAKKAKKAKAEDDSEEEGEEENEREERREEEDGDDEAKKSKKAKRAEDDDEETAKKAEARGVKTGRRLERERGAAIFGCPAAAVRPDLAAQLAFKTTMSAEEAVGVLAAAATGSKRGGIAERMAATRIPNVGSDAAQPGNDASSVAARIVAAGKKRRGEI